MSVNTVLLFDSRWDELFSNTNQLQENVRFVFYNVFLLILVEYYFYTG